MNEEEGKGEGRGGYSEKRKREGLKVRGGCHPGGTRA